VEAILERLLFKPIQDKETMMIIQFHLLEFNADVTEIETHEIFERVVIGPTGQTINDVVVKYLTEPGVLTRRMTWFHKNDDGKILDECSIAHYVDNRVPRSFAVICYGTPVQDWGDAAYDSYDYRNNAPELITGYDGFVPVLDIDHYLSWIRRRRESQRAWGLQPGIELEQPRYRSTSVEYENPETWTMAEPERVEPF